MELENKRCPILTECFNKLTKNNWHLKSQRIQFFISVQLPYIFRKLKYSN